MSRPPREIISGDTLHSILSNPLDYEWRAHGIGMLRTYLDPATRDWRLNLWHSRLLNPGISTMHTHPWAFQSFIMAGELTNMRYYHSHRRSIGAFLMKRGLISCAEFNGIEGEPEVVALVEAAKEVLGPGDSYVQSPSEIHDTGARNGTVTVMHRTAYQEAATAFVYWPVGEEWGDASRGTSEEDVLVTCAAALAELELTDWRSV